MPIDVSPEEFDRIYHEELQKLFQINNRAYTDMPTYLRKDRILLWKNILAKIEDLENTKVRKDQNYYIPPVRKY